MAATLHESFELSVETYQDNALVGRYNPKKRQYTYYSYNDVKQKVINIASGLYEAMGGFEGTCRVGIMSKNAIECFLISQACHRMSYQIVLLEPGLNWLETEFVVQHAGIDVLFVERSILPIACKAVRDYGNCLIVYFGDAMEDELDYISIYNVSALSCKQLMMVGSELRYAPIPPRPDDISSIVYTKTAKYAFKCVSLTHQQILDSASCFIECSNKSGVQINSDDVMYAFLPVSNVAQMVCQEAVMQKGGAIAFWKGNVVDIMDELRTVKPTVFVAVPRVYERLYEGIMLSLRDTHWLFRYIFSYSLYYKLNRIRKGIKKGIVISLLDLLFFDRVKITLGGDIRLLISQGNELDESVDELIRGTICSDIILACD